MEPEVENDAPPTRRETLVPALAVGAVAVVSVAAALMVQRAETRVQQQAAAEYRPASAPSRDAPSVEVVRAPPLKSPTQSMGGSAACNTCGVVQTVVAVYDEGGKKPRGYQMHIRMDDGSERTVEERGALAAGSRVLVDGNSVKPM